MAWIFFYWCNYYESIVWRELKRNEVNLWIDVESQKIGFFWGSCSMFALFIFIGVMWLMWAVYKRGPSKVRWPKGGFKASETDYCKKNTMRGSQNAPPRSLRLNPNAPVPQDDIEHYLQIFYTRDSQRNKSFPHLPFLPRFFPLEPPLLETWLQPPKL